MTSPALSPLWRGTILGEPIGRREAGEAAIVRGLLRVVKSDGARLWLARAVTQLAGSRPQKPLTATLALECRAWGGAADEIDEGLLREALERAAVVADARQIRECHRYAAPDRARPRVELVLRQVPAR